MYLVKETFVDKVCIMHNIGFQYVFRDQTHTKIVEAFTKRETFDPISIKPEKRRVALVVMIGALVLSMALTESVA